MMAPAFTMPKSIDDQPEVDDRDDDQPDDQADDNEAGEPDEANEIDGYTPYPDDDRANEHGVFERGLTEREVPIRRKAKATAYTETILAKDGLWRGSYSYSEERADGTTGSGPAKLQDDGYASEQDAVLAMLDIIAEGLEDNELASEDVAACIEAVEAWADPNPSLAETVTPAGDATPDPAADTSPEAKAKLKEAQAMQDFERRLRSATDYVAETVLAQMRAEVIAKAAKAEAKAAAEALQKIVDRGPEHYPLFEANPEIPAESARGEGEAGTSGGNQPAGESAGDQDAAAIDASQDDDDSWKDVPLSELNGIPDGVLNKLYAAQIATVGDLAAWSTDSALTDIAGIGQAKAETIEQALEKFWASRK